MNRTARPAANRRALLESLESRRHLASTISGTVFSELDADGRRENGEAGLAGQRVFIDANFDGRYENGETTQLTDASGAYSFTGLGASVFRIGVVVPVGYRQTSPALNYYDVTTSLNDTHVANDFGMTTTAIVRGTVFNDTNGNGVKDTVEQGVPNVLVFIDKNGNGKLDANEKSRYTDASGNYRFRGLPAGNYTIRFYAGRGVSLSAPASGLYKLKLGTGQSLSNRNAGILS